MTLWYAGSVVLTLGYEGQSLKECEILGKVAMQDIALMYVEKPEEMASTMFPTHQFKVSCETELLPIDEKYAE
jgi:hypothetical protein